MNTNEKRIALAKWILETDANCLNEVEAIYNSTSNKEDISEEHKKILDERLKSHIENPKSGRNWNELKAELS